jgi:hypothetical protein
MEAKESLHMFLDSEVLIKCQQMSYAVRNISKGQHFRHLALVGLKVSDEQQLLKIVDTTAYKHYSKALTK